ncbi:MAG TPA: hypothetical protein VMV23_06335 [Candidatus Nanopelagicaceae bacterium]|nr:hypothetical protein [Candidatus Nanopelagicaceae bacterium]
MTQTSAVLLGLAACLAGVAVFALIHRRDAMGALAALVLFFSAVVVALVGFSASARPAGAAQLQAFAILVELLGSLFVGVGIALTAVLWRRTGSDLLAEVLARAAAVPDGADADSEGEPDTDQGVGAEDVGAEDVGQAVSGPAPGASAQAGPTPGEGG